MITTSHENKVIVEYPRYGREVIYRLTKPENSNVHMDVLIDRLLSKNKNGLVNENVKIFLDYLDQVNTEKNIS